MLRNATSDLLTEVYGANHDRVGSSLVAVLSQTGLAMLPPTSSKGALLVPGEPGGPTR